MHDDLIELVRQLEWRAEVGDRMAELVLELGDLEAPAACPPGIRRGREGYCFANAGRRISEPLDGEPRYLYVEGFAFPDGVLHPLHHAWISDGRGAMEVTWPEPGHAYMGLQFGVQGWARLFRKYRQDNLLEPLTVAVKGARWNLRHLSWSPTRPTDGESAPDPHTQDWAARSVVRRSTGH